jgi:hypothetical protein
VNLYVVAFFYFSHDTPLSRFGLFFMFIDLPAILFISYQ